ncbi:uncharacterized protein BO97DRAFT_424319 [Aspergillus homomorphus CBS 101889]|uniref:Uncharacterized protein n=1 Tax=Aspergillus homomorphus (strain CBS 101889) TaxID=1450537 RepID=A0A395HZ71_ASPHC|nr:hypothetical protein BO97DRAFT_424319 [Aspergillus homomorphus CBS 101889]RAL12683.1 hypothetical protein BO97DRAFT_424319 [Aspergillus homomorphus CBS 101889]
MTATLSMSFTNDVCSSGEVTPGVLDGMFNAAPDTPSPVYPDRLIRPLPKRTLRSRLSSEAADSIRFPPAPATQLFYGTSVDSADLVNDAKVYVQQDDGRDLSPGRDHHYENGVELESGDEDGPVVVRRSAGFRGSSLSPSATSQPQSVPTNGDRAPIKSSSAGPDGYDAFENTNNKKKRKIPTPGSLGSHSTLSPELSTMGLAASVQPPSAGEASTYYGTGSPASPVSSGMSGAGRGRLGRPPPHRSAGRNSFSLHTPISWPRTPSRRDDLLSSPGPAGDSSEKPDQGIISAAIAHAAASAFSPPPSGSGHISMLEQQTPTPTKTQFTFTCESDSSKGMALQPPNTYPAPPRSPSSLSAAVQSQTGFSQGTQTSPNMTLQASLPNPQAQPQQPQAGAGQTPPGGRKPKRPPGTMYVLAARSRKIRQQYTNLRHPPSLEDIWICDFCEYESIFGHPPVALIRQYEIKDRKERKRLAEKKRLLEKAKTKGRKGKKATKNATKQATVPPTTYDHGYDRASVDHSSLGGGPGTHEDEDGGHEHDEEADSGPPPPPPPPLTAAQSALPPSAAPKMPATGPGARGAHGETRPP